MALKRLGRGEMKGQVQTQINKTEESNTNASNQNRIEGLTKKNRIAKIHVHRTHIMNSDLDKAS